MCYSTTTARHQTRTSGLAEPDVSSKFQGAGPKIYEHQKVMKTCFKRLHVLCFKLPDENLFDPYLLINLPLPPPLEQTRVCSQLWTMIRRSLDTSLDTDPVFRSKSWFNSTTDGIFPAPFVTAQTGESDGSCVAAMMNVTLVEHLNWLTSSTRVRGRYRPYQYDVD